jgi:hypothetical protein
MIKKKELDIKSMVADGLNKAYKQHGLLNEKEETKSVYDTLPTIPLKSIELGKKGSFDSEQLDYVFNAISGLGASSRTLENVNQIIAGINKAIGFREKKLKGTDLGLGISEEDPSLDKIDVTKLASSIYLIKFLDLIVSQQRPQAAGYIFESFVARMIGGSVVATGTPIQDVYDSQGKYVSIKVLSEDADGVKGSKIGLAKGIAKKGEVHYFVALKSDATDPFKMSFYKFTITKDNYFQFITNDPNAIDPATGEPSKNAKDHDESFRKKLKKKAVTTESVNFLTETKLTDINDIYKVELGGDPKKIAEKREELIKQFREIEISSKNLENFKKVFINQFDKDKNLIQLNKEISLASPNDFIESLINLFFPKKSDQKILNFTTYESYFFPKFINFRYIANNASQNVRNYDFNIKPEKFEGVKQNAGVAFTVDDIQQNTNKFVDTLDQELIKRSNEFHRKLIEVIQKINEKSFEKFIKTFYELMTTPSLYNEISDGASSKLGYTELKNLLDSEYKIRNEIYKKEHELVIETYKEAFAPILQWYSKQLNYARNQERELSGKSREIIKQANTLEKGKEFIDSFFKFVKDIPTDLDEALESDGKLLFEVANAGPDVSSTQFYNKFSDLHKIGIDIDENFDELIISVAQTKQIASKNEGLIKKYLEKYFDFFDRIKNSSEKYFIKDQQSSILDVSKTLAEFKKYVDETYFEGDKEKKASELTENLNNLTEEARIVMEILKRMEG